ncbi:hypothetical protein [Heyndrickxia camelliae]|uniref:Uncharacterized protein n=1 Tax=Heyndrickxia camelliae TaxID=1707093 RepID=A0A2N3LCX2_9BACI|nr:hypothetical protein [Heyndrickxia camelliae]PKR82461.1 hypothetical protein CWO92_24290 [Heyndrickxia camelliae]
MDDGKELDYEVVMVKKDGTKEVITMGHTISNIQSVPENFRLPRTYVMKNIEENKELYLTFLSRVGDSVLIEAENITKGLFNISLENEDIILTEILN